MKIDPRTWRVNPLFWTMCESIALIFAGCAVLCWQAIDGGTATLNRLNASSQTNTAPVPHLSKSPRLHPITPDYALPPIENGMVPVISRIPTQQKVVFLTIDDGAYKDTSVVSLLHRNHLQASLFLSQLFIASDPEFFTQLTAQGSIIENHTWSHDLRMIPTMGYEAQRDEICAMATYVAAHYGRRPTLFRPPGGAYNDTTRQAAAACGMYALIDWSAKANGGAMQYQQGNELHPGDIVLMHFRPEFAADINAFIEAKEAAGLRVELLENWLAVPGIDTVPVAGE